MSLAAEQREFLARLLAVEAAESAGMETYRRTLRANRHGALAAAYPVVERLVGAPFFAELATRYGETHPSRGGDLHRFGAELPAFLESYPHARALAYLPDVARLEWAVHRCGFAADARPFDAGALAAVPIARRGEVRFVPQEGTSLVASAYPIASIWEAHQRDQEVDFVGAWEAERALVFRSAIEVRVSKVGTEALMLERLLEGATLESSCREEADAAALPAWVRAGVFRGIELR
jgi:hypothetical protein